MMLEKKRGTTIWVSWETYRRLCEIGKKKETFDEIIQRVLKMKSGEGKNYGETSN
jgi:predicted CopG family antitoxin